MMPDWSAATVSRPIARGGASRATCGSLAVPAARASIDSWIPGAIAAPMYAPSGATAPNVVAVPKPTTIERRAVERARADRARRQVAAEFARPFRADFHEILRRGAEERRLAAEVS